ncbi:dihydropteroate synthase [Dictyoglomus thermophilum]|uniref:Dihydropteroate synthase n=1 Tax=Dictyoglomus thermophilum (strain ATCC 35947 / DSM 3960 / H-6-12) TaxID=309799 RepID=B5YCT5_DICT6|nr:dihydropteroate synthase [Dictyoglomus thermophilum]ACI19373.1 dihydropteroate synthase [Dictyoglomus thermophilum H-6-12]
MIVEITPEFLEKEMARVGAHPVSFEIFERKAQIIPLKIFNISSPTANIIKQEMLSLGGDAIVHKNVINCKVENSDIILLGTKKHYELLLQKLEKNNYFDLPRVFQELKEYLLKEKVREISSPWGRVISFNRILVMGIINVTPDSFYSGSRKMQIDEILKTAEDMIMNGVDIIDIGGQSTRPGSEPVSLEEEISRVIPAIENIRRNYPDVLISVDTYYSQVAKLAVEKGADIVNDISAFRFDESLVKVVAELKVPYILMHMKGTPKDMQKNPYYDDVIREIIEFFEERIEYANKNGVDPEKIIIDPGIGFGKRYEDNLEIMARLKEFKSLKKPILIGASRKSFIGKALGDLPPEERLEGTLGITALCVLNDVDIIRVHDVKENKRVVKVLEEIKCIRSSLQ